MIDSRVVEVHRTMRNVIVFFADQMRADALGCLGNRYVQTPHIDWIGRTGTILSRHITPNQICSPSRGSFFSGLYPRHHRMYRNGVPLPEDLDLITHRLTKAGYKTHGVGKFHFQPILAPANRQMPESLAFWRQSDAPQWRGPFYGFDTVDTVIGEANEVIHGGHYAAWLKSQHPDVVELYRPESAIEPSPQDLWEVWKSGVPRELHYCNWIAQRAAEFVGDAAKAEEPFFLFVSFPDPHHPFSPPSPYCYRHNPRSMPKPHLVPGELDRMPSYIREEAHPDEQGFMIRTDMISQETMGLAIAHTFGLVEMIDDAVGIVLSALQRAGALDDSLIIFTGDHGEFLGDHGLLRKGPPPYTQLLRVPFVVRGPGIATGRSIDRLSSHIDVLPTLLDYLDLPGAACDGRSLLAELRGSRQEAEEAGFAEYHPRAVSELYNRSILTKDWRLTLYPHRSDWGELFDLKADPGEHHNLFGERSTDSIVQELAKRLEMTLPPQPHIQNEILGKY